MTDAPALKDKIRTIHNQVLQAADLVQKGEDVNFTNINLDVQMLVQAIAKLSEEDGKDLKIPLMDLMQDVDSAYEKIKTQHEALADKLKNLSKSKQATQAYEPKD